MTTPILPPTKNKRYQYKSELLLQGGCYYTYTGNRGTPICLDYWKADRLPITRIGLIVAEKPVIYAHANNNVNVAAPESCPVNALRDAIEFVAPTGKIRFEMADTGEWAKDFEAYSRHAIIFENRIKEIWDGEYDFLLLDKNKNVCPLAEFREERFKEFVDNGWNVEDYQPKRSNGIGPVASGIPALDDLLGGGFQRGEVTIIAGTNQTGKSSLLAQLMGLGKGRGLFSLNDRRATVLDRMRLQGCTNKDDWVTDKARQTHFSTRDLDFETDGLGVLFIDDGDRIRDREGKLFAHFSTAEGILQIQQWAREQNVAVVITLPMKTPSPFDVPTIGLVSPSRACCAPAFHIIGIWRDESGKFHFSLMQGKDGRRGELTATFDREHLLFTDITNPYANRKKPEEEEAEEAHRQELLTRIFNGKKAVIKFRKKRTAK